MLWTIGDLHLSLGSNKPMDVFGKDWAGHVERLTEGFKRVGPDDVTVICGDLTWGMDMESCLQDFLYIHRLPGRKIILKGNHDYWWSTAAKAKSFFLENGIDSIDILHNNCFFYKDGMERFGVRECYYGHIHGAGRSLAFEGEDRNIRYKLISCDHVGFCPIKIM